MSRESSSLPEINPISTEAVRNIFDMYVYSHLLGYFIMDNTYFEIHNYEIFIILNMLIISWVTVKICVPVRGYRWNTGSYSLPIHFCVYH